MTGLNFWAIIDAIPVLTALQRMGWSHQIRRSGDVRIACPWHGDGFKPNQSCHVYGHRWYCHRCKRGGDVLDLAQVWAGANLVDAAIALCKAAGVDVPYRKRPPRRPQTPPEQGRGAVGVDGGLPPCPRSGMGAQPPAGPEGPERR